MLPTRRQSPSDPLSFLFHPDLPQFYFTIAAWFVLASQPILFLHGKRVAFSMSQHLWLLYVVFTERFILGANKH